MNSFIILQGITYIGVIIGAVYFSYRNGEKEGSQYMLQYLRKETYTDPKGNDVPFFNDTGYNRFIAHMRREKEIKDGE
tara:strand:+ start:134 stop:367 length:234 start_codon:yes stop_codon:yes gene_type:complete